MSATWSPTPWNLHNVWAESQVGIGDRKLASDFSFSELGHVKLQYYGNVVYDLIDGMVRERRLLIQRLIKLMLSMEVRQVLQTSLVESKVMYQRDSQSKLSDLRDSTWISCRVLSCSRTSLMSSFSLYEIKKFNVRLICYEIQRV